MNIHTVVGRIHAHEKFPYVEERERNVPLVGRIKLKIEQVW